MMEIARRPDVRMREIAERLGLSERTIQNLVNDLVAEGWVSRVREGRRNRYVVRRDLPVRG
jgi:DNA-binding MarR family transcriptional regulator